MPNIITHTLFANEMMESLKEQDWLQTRKHLVEIGANGPDFLFFDGLSPKHFFKGHGLSKIGSKLHSAHINDFYNSALISIDNESDPIIRMDMMAYVCGHLCHWALDSTMHPYVFYRTGDCTGRSSWNHHRMESVMDSIMLKIKRGQTIKDFDASKICKADYPEARAIARIYVPAISRIFDEDIKPSLIKDSLDDWHFMQKMFRDPSGKKIKTFKALEKISGTVNLFSGYFVPSEPIDNHDTLNLLHKEWYNPVSNEESTQSVLDLYEEALKKAETALTLFIEACNDKSKRKDFLDFLDDRNYESNTNTKKKMVNFNVNSFE